MEEAIFLHVTELWTVHFPWPALFLQVVYAFSYPSHLLVTPDYISDDVCLFLWRSILFVFDNCCGTYKPSRSLFSRQETPEYIQGMTFQFLQGEYTEEDSTKLLNTTQLALFFMGYLLVHQSVSEELLTDYGLESIMAFFEKNGYNQILLGLFYYSYGRALTQCKWWWSMMMFDDDDDDGHIMDSGYPSKQQCDHLCCSPHCQ